jgi:asparagine synthase (glutamine-hydrolysing)
MCGILLAFTRDGTLNVTALQRALSRISHRGPDSTTFEYAKTDSAEFFLGFVRLAIMDATHSSDQPIRYKDVSVLCNGEIYNPSEIYRDSHRFTNDCAGLAEYFHQTGFDENQVSQALSDIRGVFGLIAVNKDTNQLIVARDPIGVRPIFYAVEHGVLYVASEGKALIELLDFSEDREDSIRELGPGEWFNQNLELRDHYTLPTSPNVSLTLQGTIAHISSLLVQAVQRRIHSNRDRAYLLSGGVDSSAIAAIAARLESVVCPETRIHTYSIGFKNSADLIAARTVANWIGSHHHEYIISYEDAIACIPEVILNNESHDQTTTRASTPMYMLIKHITETSDARVIYSGEGADELFGGYLYFHRAPDDISAFNESRRLVEELPLYDVRRTDRSCAAHGTEARVPFLDKDLVDFVMKLPWEYRKPREHKLSNGKTVLFEKWLLRKSIDMICEGLLPENILWRPKVAFSDGVASSDDSWYGAIQKFVTTEIYPEADCSASTLETRWYRSIFDAEYFSGNREYEGVRNQWLPRWINTDGESSAMVFAESIHEGAHS